MGVFSDQGGVPDRPGRRLDGQDGRHVVAEALAKGHRVRALVRNPSQARLPAGVDVVAGDLTRPASLRSAVDVVIFTAE